MSGTMTGNARKHCETCTLGIGTFWGLYDLQFVSRPILVEGHAFGSSTICFMMHNV
jgi:hypothetical protein